jgi:hypothetical protein
MKMSQAYTDDEPSEPEIMEVAFAYYEACEAVQAQLDAQRNGAVVEGQARLPEGRESGVVPWPHVQTDRALMS